jgi:hypothetical protein
MYNQFTTAQPAATTGATLLLAKNSDAKYRRIMTAGTMFIGGAGVTTTTGHQLLAGTILEWRAGSDQGHGVFTGDVWGVGTATATAYVLEVSN